MGKHKTMMGNHKGISMILNAKKAIRNSQIWDSFKRIAVLAFNAYPFVIKNRWCFCSSR
jgi:hypothetical protein